MSRPIPVLVAFALSAIVSTTAAAQSPAAINESIRARVEAAVAEVKPALVRISVVTTAYREGRELKFQASGSGAIITPEGHVVTNHHVAGNAAQLRCTLSNREEIDAILIGQDPLTDIAIIQLQPKEPRSFPVAHFGDSTRMRVGDHVLAMGSPLALSQSVTLGILSNAELVFPANRWGTFTMDGEDVGSLVRWFGHDAVIFPGNSGGPLVNLQGEIIGINELSAGLAGAIPGNLARKVSQELMVNGEVRRAWMGFVVQPRLRNGTSDRGVLVSSVLSDSPADAAGVKPGDHILAINGKSVDIRFQEEMPEFNGFIADLPIDEVATLDILRDGENVSLEAKPVLRTEVAPRPAEIVEWGATVRNVSLMASKELKRADQNGVIVTSVRPGGPLGEAKPKVDRGDIIVSVNGEPINDVEALKAVTAKVLEGAESTVGVLVTFERKQARLVTVADIGIEDEIDPSRQVRKAWLPVETQVLTGDIAEHYGDEDLTGFIVTFVYPGSTAEAAGLEVGDAILAVDGLELIATEPEDYEELPTLIRQYKKDAEVELTLLRDEKRQRITVPLVESPPSAREMAQYESKVFEFTVRDVTSFDRAKEKIEESQSGVLIDKVTPGGWAAIGELSVGDLMLEIDGKATPDVETTRKVIAALEAEKPEAIVIRVLRGIHFVFLELNPKWN